MKKLTIAGLLMAIGSAHAATETVDCGRLLDVKSGQWRERVSIVIDSGTVRSIGQMAPDPGHVDLSGYTCLPGFIDAHVHLTDQTKPRVEALHDTLSANPADAAYRSIKF